ncbi:hypothetical protein C8R45DRAFT_397665 [Mycena sanguinolenta]|nr:hypothetical protein C8R45DRAFT_397665 [Mycena sanguinolenta]
MIDSHGPGCTPGAKSMGPRAGGRGEDGHPPALLLSCSVFWPWPARGSGHADVPLLREDVVKGERGEGSGNEGQRASHARVKAPALLPFGPVAPSTSAQLRSATSARGRGRRRAPTACCVAGGHRATSRWRYDRVQEKDAGGGRRAVGARTQSALLMETETRTCVTASGTTSTLTPSAVHRPALTAVVDFEGPRWPGWFAQRCRSTVDMYCCLASLFTPTAAAAIALEPQVALCGSRPCGTLVGYGIARAGPVSSHDCGFVRAGVSG